MEDGNNFLRQGEVAGFNGFAYRRALGAGKTEVRAEFLAYEANFLANTILRDEEPAQNLLLDIIDYLCEFPDSVTEFPDCPRTMEIIC